MKAILATAAAVVIVLAAAAATQAASEPTTWAMMIMGAGLAGSAVRRRDAVGALYTLVERADNGSVVAEEFRAPDPVTALERARDVAEGRFELWSGDALVAREG